VITAAEAARRYSLGPSPQHTITDTHLLDHAGWTEEESLARLREQYALGYVGLIELEQRADWIMRDRRKKWGP